MNQPRELDYRFDIDQDRNFVVRLTATFPGRAVSNAVFTMRPQDAKAFLEKGMLSLMASHPEVFED